jgi:methyl-accepting chemotaxis protein
MKSWTIGKRLAAGFAAVLLISTLLGIFAINRLSAIASKSDAIATVSTPAVEHLTAAMRNMLEVQKLVYEHIGSTDPVSMKQVEARIDTCQKSVGDSLALFEKLSLPPEAKKLYETLVIERQKTATIRDAILAESRVTTTSAEVNKVFNHAQKELDPVTTSYLTALDKLMENARNDAESDTKAITQIIYSAKQGVIIGLLIAILAGVGLSVLMVLGINKALRHVASSLRDAANQVTSASGQVSSASQSLAEGASEQAASIEETSSSLEEINSMTKRNAENSGTAKALVGEAKQSTEQGSVQMSQMISAMDAIKTSSDNIAMIIKTIDEIAFQTNILALNAAVEAARAGEAGAGFAVVAEEVRNLAQRAAAAAKETADKIDDSIRKSGQGVAVSATLAESLKLIGEKVTKVNLLVTEVAVASNEQSTGLAQINTAVTQMDQVTQANAGSAEETASAAEELSAQAISMLENVESLMKLVGGTGSSGKTANGDKVTQHADAKTDKVFSGKHLSAPHPHAAKTLPARKSSAAADFFAST